VLVALVRNMYCDPSTGSNKSLVLVSRVMVAVPVVHDAADPLHPVDSEKSVDTVQVAKDAAALFVVPESVLVPPVST
jgi:hypothetical protein